MASAPTVTRSTSSRRWVNERPRAAARRCAGAPPSPRAANPERPTVATHAYTVAPGYAELEQGARAFGLNSYGEATAWDFNLKIGVRPGVQLGVFGAGQALGGLVGVFSADLPKRFHFDANAGPVGIGAGKPQWFTSVGLAHGGIGAVGVATELFDATRGAAGPRQHGFLAALMVTAADWVVVDGGGVLGLWMGPRIRYSSG